MPSRFTLVATACGRKAEKRRRAAVRVCACVCVCVYVPHFVSLQ